MIRQNFQSVLLFGKAQFSAFCGGLVDYGTMILLTEFLGIHYLISITIGGLIGALVNFSINRNWTFRKQKYSIFDQLKKFIIVVTGSIFLKSIGTSFFTEILSIDYRISRFIADALVCFGFNYSMQKRWVFN